MSTWHHATGTPSPQPLIDELQNFRTKLLTSVRTIEVSQPATGSEMRPFCQVFLSIDRLRLDLEDLPEAGA
jgi:hypothetical protein